MRLSLEDWKEIRIYRFKKGISFQKYVVELIKEDMRVMKKVKC